MSSQINYSSQHEGKDGAVLKERLVVHILVSCLLREACIQLKISS